MCEVMVFIGAVVARSLVCSVHQRAIIPLFYGSSKEGKFVDVSGGMFKLLLLNDLSIGLLALRRGHWGGSLLLIL